MPSSWKIISNENGLYTYEGTGTDNMGTRFSSRQAGDMNGTVENWNEFQSKNITGTFDNLSQTNVSYSDERRYPSDDRLTKFVTFNDKQQIRPYNTDDMAHATGGIFNKDAAKNNHETEGVPALINNYAIVQLYGAYGGNQDKMHSLIDTPGKRRWYENSDFGGSSNNPILTQPGYSKDVTVSKLIEFGNTNKRGITPYYYSDFAYCKYFNRIPNNYLITLRRYAVPAFDSLDFPFYKDDISFGTKTVPIKIKDQAGNELTTNEPLTTVTVPQSNAVPDEAATAPPVAQAVTWIGDATDNKLSSILSFSVGMPWEDLTADMWDNDEQYTNESHAPSWMKGFASALGFMDNNPTNKEIMYDGQVPPDPYQDGPYYNRIKGPENRIDTVKQRKAGLEFSHSLSLKFHYTARSIGGINTKAAMLDIISNFLVLCYSSAPFWGGVNRFRGSYQSFTWKKGLAALYSGDPAKFFDAISGSLSNVFDQLSSMFNNILKDPIGGLKALASDVGGKLLAGSLRKKAPLFHGMRSLLIGEPVGEWHLTVGNPFNPILMIGNLVCKKCSFEFNDELGPDDFPTEMTVTVELEHGMPRDRIAVESMFNKGSGRIYALPENFEAGFSSANSTRVDTSFGDNTIKKNVNTINEGIDFDKVVESGINVGRTVADKTTLLAARYGLGFGGPENKNKS